MSDDSERLAAPSDAQKATTSDPGVEISEQALIGALSTVYDPEIPVNIYDLGLVYLIDVGDSGRVHIEMTLTSPGCPSAQALPVEVREAVMTVDGVTDVDVQTVWDPPWDPSRMSEDAKLQLNMY